MTKTHPWILGALLASLAVNAWQVYDHARTRQIAEDAQKNPAASGPIGGLLSRAPSNTPGNTPAQNGTQNPSASAAMDLESIMAIRDPMDRMQAMIEHLKNVPTDELGALFEQWRSKGKADPKDRFLAHLLLTRWGREDPEAAFASLGELGAKRNGSEANAILAGLAATDPARAVAWLTDPDNKASDQPWLGVSLARTLALEWSRQDPDAAMAWASSLEAEELQNGAYEGIINDLVTSDPERAASVAMEVESSARPKLLGQIAESWAEQSPEAAVDWAKALEGADRQAAMAEAVSGWAQTAPHDAAAYLDTLPESESQEYVGNVARSWAEEAPAEAAHWLGSQPESESKAGAMGHVMWGWTNSDPEAASAWLVEQPPGESFDRGATGLAKAATHAFDDPEAGVTWASAIANEELRANMTRHTLGQWMNQDPTAAQAWANENGVEVSPARSYGK